MAEAKTISPDTKAKLTVNGIEPLILSELKRMDIKALEKIAKEYDIENATSMLRQDLIFALLNAQTAKGGAIYSQGVLETLPDGFGFLRSPDFNYIPGPDDIYVSPSQIRRFNLRTGDTIEGQVRPPKDNERYYALLKVEKLNFEEPEHSKDKTLFDNLTPLYPAKSSGLNMAARTKPAGSSTCSARSAKASGA